jgi:hypothetical protein
LLLLADAGTWRKTPLDNGYSSIDSFGIGYYV